LSVAFFFLLFRLLILHFANFLTGAEYEGFEDEDLTRRLQ
jgi:hypothetical protein